MEKKCKKGFSHNFWTAVSMEFFERGSYYGMMSVLSVFLVLCSSQGGLGLDKEQSGLILSIVPAMAYFIPILGGAIADRYGYRKILFFAFSFMSLGYFFAGFFHSFELVFAALILMALGAGIFKPIISGTISKSTTPDNSSLGFGIYYWSINLGSFIFPLFLIPFLKSYSYSYIFYMAAILCAMMLIVNLFIFKEPFRTDDEKNKKKSIGVVFEEMVKVITDWKFMLMIVLYSCFWIMYFQMFGSVLWYVNDYMDMTSVNNFVNTVLSIFIENPTWKFDVEHVTVINSLVIIAFQILVSNLIKKTRTLPTMIVGIGFGVAGMLVLAISSAAWVFIIGMVVFTFGEMVAHPKYMDYVGQIAPKDKKALYMGYLFLYGVIGNAVGGILGANLYVRFVEQLNQPAILWVIFALIGMLSIVGLLLYNKFIVKK